MAYRYTVNHLFFSQWSAPMAWVLGIIYADGNINRGKTCSGRLRVGMQDRDVLENIRRAMGSTHPIKLRRYGKHWYWKIDIGSKRIYDDLVALGLTHNKSTTMLFPPVPKNLVHHFIRGYIDGDGTISKDKRPHVEIYSGSIEFMKSLLSTCRQQGIVGSLRVGLPFAHRLRFSVSESAKLIAWIYRDHAGLCMDRKLRRALVNL